MDKQPGENPVESAFGATVSFGMLLSDIHKISVKQVNISYAIIFCKKSSGKIAGIGELTKSVISRVTM